MKMLPWLSMEQVNEVASYLESSLQGITDLAWVQAQYAGEVSYADEQLGRLLHELESLGHDKDTLVVVAGDHGESLGEHGVCVRCLGTPDPWQPHDCWK